MNAIMATNWDWFGHLISEKVKKNPDKPVKVLNLFAYTGGATLAAAAAGAAVTHVDASCFCFQLGGKQMAIAVPQSENQ